MYLHLGGDKAISVADIVALFDMDNTTITARSRKFLQKAAERGEIYDVSEDLPRSYIVTNEGGKSKVYISSLTPKTLIKRAKSK